MEFNDGVVKAWALASGYMAIEWLTPGLNKVRAIRDVRHIETLVRQHGLKGWLMASERSHTQMHPIIQKLGGKQYADEHGHYFFMKAVA